MRSYLIAAFTLTLASCGGGGSSSAGGGDDSRVIVRNGEKTVVESVGLWCGQDRFGRIEIIQKKTNIIASEITIQLDGETSCKGYGYYLFPYSQCSKSRPGVYQHVCTTNKNDPFITRG